MTHLGYIATAYVAVAVVLVAMVLWVVLDLKAQKEKLKRIEDERLGRGSGASQ